MGLRTPKGQSSAGWVLTRLAFVRTLHQLSSRLESTEWGWGYCWLGGMEDRIPLSYHVDIVWHQNMPININNPALCFLMTLIRSTEIQHFMVGVDRCGNQLGGCTSVGHLAKTRRSCKQLRLGRNTTSHKGGSYNNTLTLCPNLVHSHRIPICCSVRTKVDPAEGGNHDPLCVCLLLMRTISPCLQPAVPPCI